MGMASKIVLLTFLSISVNPPKPLSDESKRAKKDFITCIRNKIEEKTNLRLIHVYNEERKTKVRSLMLANRMDRSTDSNKLTIKSMVTFSPHELEYLRLLVDAILNDPMRELEQIKALNLGKKVKRRKVSVSQTEIIVEKFIEHKWLVLSSLNNIRLSTRFIYEMEPFLRNVYRNKSLNCNLCEKIVIRSVECPNKSCDLQLHSYCAALRSNQCFKCEESLPSKRKLYRSSSSGPDKRRRKSSTF